MSLTGISITRKIEATVQATTAHTWHACVSSIKPDLSQSLAPRAAAAARICCWSRTRRRAHWQCTALETLAQKGLSTRSIFTRLDRTTYCCKRQHLYSADACCDFSQIGKRLSDPERVKSSQ